MTTVAERAELLELFLAAMRAVVPDVTLEQYGLLQGVVEGMLRERGEPLTG